MSNIFVKLTAATVIEGYIRKAEEVIEMVEHEAIDLFHRGRAVPATDDDVATHQTEKAAVAQAAASGQSDAAATGSTANAATATDQTKTPAADTTAGETDTAAADGTDDQGADKGKKG